MLKNILLTGATGFLGSKLLEALIKEDYKVIILLRPTSSLQHIRHLSGKYVSYVIESGRDIDNNIFIDNGIETIIHTATEYGREGILSSVLDCNVKLPMELIEKGLKYGLKRFINTDTFFCKSIVTPSYLKDYVASKKTIHEYLINYCNSIQVDNMMLEHVFGENDSEKKFVTFIINKLLSNESKILLTEGNQKRDFIYSSDVVNAFIQVLKNRNEKIGFMEFEVGRGESISVKEFVLKIAAKIESNSELFFGAIPTRSDEIMDSKAQTKNLNNLGWYPKYEIDTALQILVDYEKSKFLK